MERDKELSVQIQTRLIEQVSAYEGRYRRLVDNLHDLLVELDDDGRILFANRTWSEWLRRPVESVRQQFLGSFMAAAEARALAAVLANHNPSLGPEHRMDVTLLDARGREHQFELSLRRGHSGGWVALLRSNSERRAAEAQLREANALLQTAAQLKDNFMATMSHELRTPLNAMLALCECLTEKVYGPMLPKQLQAVQTVEQNGAHLLRLINDILDLSRIQAGMMRLESETVDLPMLVSESVAMVRPLAEQKCQRITVHMPQGSVSVRADRVRLRQVLLNLIGNACKFTPAGGAAQITVQSQGSRQLVSVEDNGPGIAPEAEVMLFQCFAQGDAGLNRERQEGSGLGLVLALRMIALMGGSISYSTSLGKGSRFTVALPALVEAADQSAWQAEMAALPAPVLIVAGGPVLPDTSAENVVWVHSLAAAKIELARRPFHGVILHAELEQGEARETVSRFRREALPDGKRLLVLCSLLSLHHCRELHSAGADGCLAMPLDWEELLGWLEPSLQP